MPITFRKLEVFVAAATDGNFRKTADRLGISQPSVSAQIRSIEIHLGYELFERRRGSSATLSDGGRDFLAQARALVKAEGELAAERHTVRRTHAAVLRLSVGPILLEKRLKPVLPQFHERYPNIALEFLPFNPAVESEKSIRAGTLDVLMYTGGPYERSRVHSETIARVGARLYASTAMAARLAGREVDISTVPYVSTPSHFHISRWFETQLAATGIRPRNVVARAPYLEVARQLIANGKGVGVLFDEHAAEYVDNGKLRAIESTEVPAYRVMVLGRRALRAEMAPALGFLRTAAESLSADAVAARGIPERGRRLPPTERGVRRADVAECS